MIGYVKGRVLSFSDGAVLLENNGIGYEITCSASVYGRLVNDMEGEVYTYMSVKEDGVSLYGFSGQEEKNMFLSLISVSGVGPKMGIAILSGMSLKDLMVKIATGDVKGLSSVKGLGKKTAERIILELKEKMGASGGEQLNAAAGADTSAAVSELASGDEDAAVALMGLGFTRGECVKALKAARAAGAETAEQLISYALKHIK